MVTVGVRPLVQIKGGKGDRGPIGARGPAGDRGPQGIPGPGGAVADDTIAAALASLSSETRQGLLTALSQEAGGVRQQPGFYEGVFPSGFAWPTSTHPIYPSISVDQSGKVHGSAGYSARDFFDMYSWARTDPTRTIYVSASGSNSNSGNSPSESMRTIRAAINRLNNSLPLNRGGRIYVDGSTPLAYGYTYGTGSFGNVNPQMDLALIGYNGTPIVGPYADISAMTRPSGSQAWSCEYFGSAIPVRCIDTASQDADGVHRDLTWVETVAEVNATPGTWTYAGPMIYVRRHDDRIVSPQSIMVLVDDINTAMVSNNNDTYVENIKFFGGRGIGSLAAGTTPNAATKCVFVVSNCEMSYGGGLAHLSPTQNLQTNGFGTNSFYGVIALFDCVSRGAQKDAFNWHALDGKSLAALTVNCRGLDTGREDEGTSMNGWTLHEDVVGVDIAGQYRRSRGGTIHNIGTSRAYMLGTVSTDDAGDVEWGGSIEPVQYRASVNARIWLDRAFASGPGLAYGTADSGQVRVHAPLLTAAASSGDVASY